MSDSEDRVRRFYPPDDGLKPWWMIHSSSNLVLERPRFLSEFDGTQIVAGDGEHPRTLDFNLDHRSHRGPVLGEDTEAVHGRLAPSSGEHEPANPVLNSQLLLDRSIPNPLVSSDDDQTRSADEGQPHLVESSPRDLGEALVTGIHHVGVDRSKHLPERQVVLIDEEPDRHDHYATRDRNCSS